MFKNQYVRLALIVVPILGLLIAFSPPADRWTWLAPIGVMALFLLLGFNPILASFISRKPRVIVGLGVTLLVLSIVGMIVFVAADSGSDSRVVIPVTTGGLLLGTLLLFVPRTVRDVKIAKAEAPAIQAARREIRFSATGEVMECLRLIAREWLSLLKIVGPCLIVFCLLPFVFLAPFWKGIAKEHPWPVLSAILVVLLAMCCALLAVVILWARFVRDERWSSFGGLPGALWGFLWRIFFFSGIVGTFRELEPWTKAHLATAAPWVISGLTELALLAALVLASPVLMVFVSVALGDADRSLRRAMRGRQLSGRGFYLGVLFILSPITAASWLMDLRAPAASVGAADIAAGISWVLLLLLTVIAITTYLTRAYLRPLPTPASSDWSPF